MNSEQRRALAMQCRFEIQLLMMASGDHGLNIPEVEVIANNLKLSPLELDDILRSETGKSAKEWLYLEFIDRAKELMFSSKLDTNELASTLGRELLLYSVRPELADYAEPV